MDIWNSRRSPVFSTKGVCASSQVLASKIGTKILESGGNAADACVAMAAALAVTEPCSTGLGGDCFCLFYDAKSKKVKALNGSGRAPYNLKFDKFVKCSSDVRNVNCITVPGACAGWIDTLKEFGTMSASTVLQPAIDLAEKGFPVSVVTAHHWGKSEDLLRNTRNGNELLVDGKRAPQAGEIFKNPNLAKVLREIQKSEKKGFYEGWIANEIVKVIQELGGEMTLKDLKQHSSIISDAISVNYKGYTVHEIGPNSQGITALIALNILEGFNLKSMGHNSEEYLHTLVESLRLAFSDARQYVCCPDKVDNECVKKLLSKDYAETRRKLIYQNCNKEIVHGYPLASSDTVYFCCVDSKGNACSFVNSNYMGFGTGIVPKGCGFSLQNRGANFVCKTGHPNCFEPGKRSYHTIIPAICTKDGELYCAFGVMGGFQQPQGHVQVLLNMLEFGMNPQTALDAPRFCIEPVDENAVVLLEDGIDNKVVEGLQKRNHKVKVIKSWSRSVFGRGQIILKHPTTKVLWAGSDPRADGCAIPEIYLEATSIYEYGEIIRSGKLENLSEKQRTAFFKDRLLALKEFAKREPKAAYQYIRSNPIPETEYSEKKFDKICDLKVIASLPLPGKPFQKVRYYIMCGNTYYQAYPAFENPIRSLLQTQLSGYLIDDIILLDNSKLPSTPPYRTTGDRTFLIIRIDFSDMTGDPVSTSKLDSTFTQIRRFWNESSFGKLYLQSWTVTNTLRVPKSTKEYRSDDMKLMTDAENTAKAANIKIDDYDFYAIAFKEFGYEWAGQAYVGAPGIWLNGYFDLMTIAHECAHNFGAQHANYYENNDTPRRFYGGKGKREEYGDIFDVQGGWDCEETEDNVENCQWNLKQKQDFEWASEDSCLLVEKSGDYTIYASDHYLSDGKLMGLKFNWGMGNRENKYFYYVSFRQKIENNAKLRQGAVTVHMTYVNSNGTDLIDTTLTRNKKKSPVAIGETWTEDYAYPPFEITPIKRECPSDGSPCSMQILVKIGMNPVIIGNIKFLGVERNIVKSFLGSQTIAYVETAQEDVIDWNLPDGTVLQNTPFAKFKINSIGNQTLNVEVSNDRGSTTSETHLFGESTNQLSTLTVTLDTSQESKGYIIVKGLVSQDSDKPKSLKFYKDLSHLETVVSGKHYSISHDKQVAIPVGGVHEFRVVGEDSDMVHVDSEPAYYYKNHFSTTFRVTSRVGGTQQTISAQVLLPITGTVLFKVLEFKEDILTKMGSINFEIISAGHIKLEGNGDLKILYPYTITPQTVLELEFRYPQEIGTRSLISIQNSGMFVMDKSFALYEANSCGKCNTQYMIDKKYLSNWNKVQIKLGKHLVTDAGLQELNSLFLIISQSSSIVEYRNIRFFETKSTVMEAVNQDENVAKTLIDYSTADIRYNWEIVHKGTVKSSMKDTTASTWEVTLTKMSVYEVRVTASHNGKVLDSFSAEVHEDGDAPISCAPSIAGSILLLIIVISMFIL